jgi:hypothetical protein
MVERVNFTSASFMAETVPTDNVVAAVVEGSVACTDNPLELGSVELAQGSAGVSGLNSISKEPSQTTLLAPGDQEVPKVWTLTPFPFGCRGEHATTTAKSPI